MDDRKDLILKPGVKYRTLYFQDTCEIKEIRKEENQMDIIRIPSDDRCWEIKNLNLQDVIKEFRAGNYIVLEPEGNFGVW